MNQRIVIKSEMIEEKMRTLQTEMRILDGLNDNLYRIRQTDAQIEKKNLARIIQEVKELRYGTEKMHEILDRFMYDIEKSMLQNEGELRELESDIARLFL